MCPNNKSLKNLWKLVKSTLYENTKNRKLNQNVIFKNIKNKTNPIKPNKNNHPTIVAPIKKCYRGTLGPDVPQKTAFICEHMDKVKMKREHIFV